MIKTDDILKMPVAGVDEGDLSPKTSARIVITPFIKFRKSFKRFKQKKRLLQEDSVNKMGCDVIDNNSNKIKPPAKELENTMNILKRLSAYRASKKKKKKTAINSSLNIVKWSSCESISDGKIGKHNSLRRSRASLLMPVYPDDCCHAMNGSTKKIPQYGSMNCINNKTNPLSSEMWYSSSQQISNKSSPDIIPKNEELSLDNINTSTPINFCEEISQELSQFFGTSATLGSISNNPITSDGNRNIHKRAKIKKSKSHSLSLPNISEHNIEETSIDIDIDNVDVIVEEDIGGTSTSCQQNFKTDLVEQRKEKYKRYSASYSSEKLLLTPTNIADICCMYLSNDSIFSSSMSINRPPIPCCPKPTDRLDLILKSASTEALSARKHRRSDENLANEHLVARKRTNSSPECTAQRKKEARKSADYVLNVSNEESRLDGMNCRLPKPNLRGYTSTTDLPNLFFNKRLWKKALSCHQLPYAIAEAVWDHTSLNPEELHFSSGDVLHVLFMEDDSWWWGARGDKEGWFPATYVRQCVIQEIESGLSCKGDFPTKNHLTDVSRKSSLSSRVADEEKLKAVRAKCVEELLTTEMDYVQLLKNIIEGYLVPVRNEEQLFSKEDAVILFSNIEELHEFHKEFVKELQDVINLENMETSSVGCVFLKNETRFEIYSQYCNNQPKSSARLSSLTKDKKYKCFFERCRLKQNMIRLSLDGFLLSPVQRICKYPLQLKELLKHTSPEHEDYQALGNARACMQNVASLINERKRRLENVHNIACWQYSVVNWKDEDIALKSSELIHTGVLSKIIANRIVERIVYVFDHQLIYFRKYSAKRHHLSYCGRIDLDNANIVNIEDSTLVIDNINITNAWKIWDATKTRWHLFYAKSGEEKEEWLTVFHTERKHVQEESEKGLKVLLEVREAAIENAHTKNLSDLKRRRIRRKSTLSYTTDFDGFPTSPLHSKFSDIAALCTSESVPKRRQRGRRKNSFRWSLGSMFEKHL